MQKIGIFIVGMLVISLGMFSGCTNLQDELSDVLGKMKIVDHVLLLLDLKLSLE